MKGKWFWVIISAIAFMLVGGVLYILAMLEKISMPSPKSLKVFLIILGLFACCVGIAWFVYYLMTRKKKKGDDDSQIEPPKIPVASGRAIKVWCSQYIIETDIPYTINDKGEIMPINRDAIVVRNEKSHVDETGQTSDRFISFEAIVTQGSRPGLKVLSIPLDRGEEHIRANWNQWIIDGRSMNLIPGLAFEKFPKTSARELRDRLATMKVRMIEEGIEAEEIKRVFAPFEALAEDEKPGKPAVAQALAAPAMTGQVLLVQDEDEDSEEGESIRDDIESYRKSNS